MKRVVLCMLWFLVALLLPGTVFCGTDVTVEWDPSPTAGGVAGYIVYYKVGAPESLGGPPYTNSVDVGNVLEAVLPGLPSNGSRIFFAATAYDGEGRESDYSNEVSAIFDNRPFTDVQASVSVDQITLTWTPSMAFGIVDQTIYMSNTSGSYTPDPHVTVGPEVGTVLIGGLSPGTYFFVIRTRFSDGSETPLSNEVQAVIAAPPAPPGGCSIRGAVYNLSGGGD